MKQSLIILLTLIIALITPSAFAVNRVLSLDGDGDYVEIADSESLNAINSQATMEAWIKATAFPDQWIPIIHKSDEYTPNYGNRSYALQLNSSGFISLASAPSGQGQIYLNSPSDLIALDTWYHVAGVVDAKSSVMRIFINGAEIAHRDFGKDIHVSKLSLRIGWWREEKRFPFAGQIDEVRIWNIARTEEEIQSTMHTTLSGKEPGLVGYWRFDDEEDIVTDSSPSHSDGKLIGDAHFVEAELPTESELVIPTVISGNITDEMGNPIPEASVRLEQDGEEIAKVQADASGNYRIAFFHPRGQYDLSATSDELGSWRLGIRLREGEGRKLNLTLKEAVSIEGKLLMLDDKTPHVAVSVQAVSDGKMVDGTLSDGVGKYRFINLKPGRYQVRCYTPGEYVYYSEGKDKPAVETSNATSLRVEQGKTIQNINFRFASFKKGTWKTYTYLDDGFDGVGVLSIHRAPDGVIWFGTRRGVYRYDGKAFVNLTMKNGLVDETIYDIYQDPDGIMWFGTQGGVSRYDGKEFVNFTTEDGLANNTVDVIYPDPDGFLWFGTGATTGGSWRSRWRGVKNGGGVSRYDGRDFVNFTTKDGLVHNAVFAIHKDANGTLWFGTGGGVSRYDGKEFVNFTTKDGLANNVVSAIHRDRDGVMWFGTYGGVSRYDGKEFINFTTEDGLANNNVCAIHGGSDGVIWFGTYGGVSLYDGKGFVNFTTEDGLADNWILSIHTDPDGVMWFGTGEVSVSRYDRKGFANVTTKDGFVDTTTAEAYRTIEFHRATSGSMWIGTLRGGVFRFDGKECVNLTTKDGLASNNVYAIHSDPDGVMWFGTAAGVSRYDGKEFVNFTTEDGLASNNVYAIHSDPNGVLWFRTTAGVSRYDGKEFVNFTTEDGLASNWVNAIHSAPDGVLWFGTAAGVSRYDGKEFVNFTTEDGLASNNVYAIHSDPNGVLWFRTTAGVSRYDGKEFVNFTTEDGLASNWVNAIHHAPDGVMWFGTEGGISRYDGKEFVNFTTEDGLASNNAYAIHSAPDGMMWFGIWEGGVHGYDGITWTSLDTRDGLVENKFVWKICQDSDGTLWFWTSKGATHYRRSLSRPGIRIVSVRTNQRYTELSAIPPITTGTRVTIEYNAIDLKTLLKKRQYRVCIVEGVIDSASLKKEAEYWLPPTKESTFEHTFPKPGTYTFAVQAIDRDLNYSEPATLTLHVKRPWWVFALFGTIGITIPLVVVGFYLGKRLQTQRAIAQQFNPYIAGRVVGEDMFYGRNDLITEVERTLHNNCFLLYGERRIGKTSLQHQLAERLSNAGDPTYKFIPAYIDLQGVAEDDFFRTIATGIVEQAASLFESPNGQAARSTEDGVEHAASLFKDGREALALRLDEDRARYTYRDFTRDLRTILDHLKEGETKTIKLVLLMDEIDTLNEYSLRTNLNLRGLFMGQLKENLVLVMSGLYLKMDWSEEGGGSPPFNFLSREIQIQPLDEAPARELITEPVKGFYSYESEAVNLIIEYSELKPFTIQGFCLRAVARILADGRTKITVDDIEAIKDSVLAELQSIRGERAGTSLPASFNEALALIADLKEEVARLQDEAA